MLFGTSKLVTERINWGESYGKVRKEYRLFFSGAWYGLRLS